MEKSKHKNMKQLKDGQEKQAMLDAIKEISLEMSKMDDARDQIKEIIIAASAALEVEKKMIRKVAKLYHQKTVATFENETSEIKSLYNQITVI
jgi:hypothetical protein